MSKHTATRLEPEKKGKVIIIGGCPRAGKTTLSVRLVKSGKGFSALSGDSLFGAISESNIDKFEFFKKIDDDYIGEVAKRIYYFNIKLKEDCEKNHYRFINTGIGKERNIVLNAVYDEIIKSCSN